MALSYSNGLQTVKSFYVVISRLLGHVSGAAGVYPLGNRPTFILKRAAEG